MTGSTPPRHSAEGTGLRARAVGVVPIAFISLATIAPAASLYAGMLLVAPYGKGSTPFAVVLSLFACLMVAISIGQMARHLPSAGGLYTYVVAGLGRTAGFLVGWIYLFAYVLLPTLAALIFGFAVGGYLQHAFSFPTWTWLPIVVVSTLLAAALAHRGIRQSSYVGIILGVFEIVIFGAIALTLIAKAGPANTASVFLPAGAGVFPAMIFIVLNFIGFESSVALAEEADLPRRTVPKAVIGSCLTAGGFYLLCYYAATVFFGPGQFGGTAFTSLGGGNPWGGMAAEVWGPAAILASFAVWSAQAANVNASINPPSRVLYALARARLLPAPLARVQPEHQTPSVAILGLGGFSVVLAIVLPTVLGSPLLAFALLGTVLTLMLILVYMGTCASCIVYYLRKQRGEFRPLMHLVFPLLGIAIFVPVFIAALGIDFAGLGIAPLERPLSLAPWIVAGWLALGIVYLTRLRRAKPEAIDEMGVSHSSEDPPVVPPAQGMAAEALGL
ncbi:APC family permease [Streptomyces sp. BK340]|uniref:APC family permease n=1 Tax=Streptomyces sp. BK340 TaxID=2572903 RepID=UPI00119D9B63|nr:APC family permease [Streptomyces sp. BK340]TVZ75453.1 amino acid/polyamine/organocation transporter (APC superfamily) [Streptomyces sp. BK340]